MTKIKFYRETKKDISKYYTNNFNCFAVFPEIEGSHGNMLCYAHIGQHSSCSREYIRGKRLATKEEYQRLLNELVSLGYDDLQVLNKK